MTLTQVKRWIGKARSLGLKSALPLARKELARKFLGRLSLLPTVPPKIFVELTDKCNLRCVFCDRNGLTRPSGMMSMDLFKRIIDDAARIGVPTVKLNRFGESLLHPELPEMIRYAKERGIPRVHLTSNATLLTEEKSRQLIEAGLDMIAFSIDGGTKETFERTRVNAKYDQVKENVLRFVRMRNEMGRRAPWVVIPSGVSRETEKEISALAETWSPHVDEIRLHPVVIYGNVENLTRIERYDGASARRPCPQVFDRLVIFWNGTATVCCADINGDLSVGHVDESGIKDLWNNARFSEIRRKHAHLDIGSLPICMKCDVTSAVHHRLKQEQLSRVKKEAAQVGFKF